MLRYVSSLTDGHLQGVRKFTCAASAKIHNELSEDGQQLKSKHAWPFINK